MLQTIDLISCILYTVITEDSGEETVYSRGKRLEYKYVITLIFAILHQLTSLFFLFSLTLPLSYSLTFLLLLSSPSSLSSFLSSTCRNPYGVHKQDPPPKYSEDDDDLNSILSKYKNKQNNTSH